MLAKHFSIAFVLTLVCFGGMYKEKAAIGLLSPFVLPIAATISKLLFVIANFLKEAALFLKAIATPPPLPLRLLHMNSIFSASRTSHRLFSVSLELSNHVSVINATCRLFSENKSIRESIFPARERAFDREKLIELYFDLFCSEMIFISGETVPSSSVENSVSFSLASLCH